MPKSRALSASDRERRLRLWTLVVVAIHSSLGLARRSACASGDRGLATGVSSLGCVLVLVTVVTQGRTVGPSGARG